MQAIEQSSAPTAISKPHAEQRKLSLVKSLLGLAEARQAAVSPETLRLYSASLASFREDDVRQVIGDMARTPRRDGETAFPSLGEITRRACTQRDEREAAESAERKRQNEELFFWDWVDCRRHDTGRSEQSILDSVRTPGFTGRKARQ